LAAGVAGEIEGRLRRFDGEYRRFSIKTGPLTDDSGRIIGWCGINTDIEDRRRAEEALLAHERRFQFIIDGLPAIVALFTPQGRIAYCNRQMLDYLDETLEGVQAKASAYNFHPDERDEVLAEWAGSVQSGQPFDRDARLQRADGVYRWHRTRVFPLRDAAGEIELWYGLSIDIEDTRRAEQELRRSNAFLAEAQQVSATGSLSWRVAAAEIVWSEQVYRMFGLEPGEPVTLEKIGSRVHPEDLPMLQDMVARAEAGEADFDYEHRLVMPDHSIKHLHLMAHRVGDPTGPVEYIGAVQDVTARRTAEAALSLVRSELAHVARVSSLGALTASIAHEVSQPLSGIITNASTGLRMLAADPPNIEGALETTRRTLRDGGRASEVITRLRALFGKKGVTTEPVDLNEAAREVIALSRGDLQRSRVVVQGEQAE
jgi:PAS domain S-box-containing protein